MCYSEDAKKSRVAFAKFSTPALKKFFGDSAQILPTENQASEVEKALDFVGIDGLIAMRDGTAYFYASRVQFVRVHNFKSFSLRSYRPSGAATEFAKLQRAKKNYSAMPAYHIQTFVNTDEQTATVGIVKTIDLLRYVEEKKPETRHTSSGEEFYVIPWRELKKVKVYRVDANGNNVEDLTADYLASA